jgi:putative flavoprotein involved in K+ transport
MYQKVDTIIVGGGQAGLSTSYFLTQQDRAHLVLEKTDRPASAWQDGRWDSFTLVTPNWSFRLPGAEYKGSQPEEFMPRDEVVERFREYVKTFHLPIRYNTTVTSITHTEDGQRFFVKTQDDIFETKNVVMATGLFQRPKLPACAQRMPNEIQQIHSGNYRNPAQLSAGAVLVVGSSQSGCQIADEIYKSGRQVYLCVGESGRAPRRYRSKDSSEWLKLLGLEDRTVDMLPSPKIKYAGNPHISGKTGAQNINLHQFSRDGIVLLGRLEEVNDGIAQIGSDLQKNLLFADNFENNFTKNIDNYIEKNKLDVPVEKLTALSDGFNAEIIRQLDLKAAGIETVLWAVGYSFDFDLVKFSIFDEDGYPIHKRGVTAIPGLYFIGLPWLHNQKSGLLGGVGDDAAFVAAQIQACKHN